MSNLILNVDSEEIKNYELTPEGYMRLWLAVGVADQDLVYDSRVETIDLSALIDKSSINTAVGKPVVLNHPPQAVLSNNFSENAKGISLQEIATDSNTAFMASVIWDDETISKIKNKEITHTSSAYIATKTPNQDGSKIKQTNRVYNHFAVLTPENAPRAGRNSRILLLNTDSQPTNNNGKTTTELSQPTMNIDSEEIKNRTELLVNYKAILDEKKIAIDYNLDSKGIKKLILSCYYPPQILNQINSDSVLDGFWLNFNVNQLQKNQESIPVGSFNFNQDNADPVQVERQKYIDRVSGKTPA